MPFRALRGFNRRKRRGGRLEKHGRNALPGIEGIQPQAALLRVVLDRVVGRNALPGIEGIQPQTLE